MVTTERPFTLADYADLPDDDRIYDILGGKLFVHNVPEDNHAEALTEMFAYLLATQDAGFGRVYTSSRAVALDYSTRGMASIYVTHPDLFFVSNAREHLRARRAYGGVPDLVVEILSPSTEEEHAPGGDLWRAYEQHGLPHYWIVNPRVRTIALYALRGEPFVQGTYGDPTVLLEPALLTTPLFPGVVKPLSHIFRYVVDHER